MAVYTKLSLADAATIAKNWNLGEVSSFEGIAKGSVNTNYRLVTGAGTFFVRLDETRTPAEVQSEIELVSWLVAHGFPTPEPLPAPLPEPDPLPDPAVESAPEPDPADSGATDVVAGPAGDAGA